MLLRVVDVVQHYGPHKVNALAVRWLILGIVLWEG